MSKTKMRCITCGKWFQSANAKEVTCPDCMQKARKEKQGAKTAPPTNTAAGQGAPGAPARQVPPPPKPKQPQGGGSHWLDTLTDVKVGQPDQPPPRPKLPPLPKEPRREVEPVEEQHGPPSGYRDRDERGPRTYDDKSQGNYRDTSNRGPGNYREGGRGPGGYRENEYRGGYRVGGGSGLPGTTGPRPRQPMEGGGRGPRPGGPGENRDEKFRPAGKKDGKGKPKTPKPVTPPKPKREKIPPPAPFSPTPEQVTQVEERYIELAQPAEFDGIRTQIAKELSIPKTAVKKIIKELRDRQGIPSWWELQSYKGPEEELAKIRAAYEPYMLPLPPIGIHKQIAEQLSLKPGDVYQAIKAIRLEMNLPQFNDPALHGIELKPRAKKAPATAEQPTESQEPREETVPSAEAEATPQASSTEESATTPPVSSTEETTAVTPPVSPTEESAATPPVSSVDDTAAVPPVSPTEEVTVVPLVSFTKETAAPSTPENQGTTEAVAITTSDTPEPDKE